MSSHDTEKFISLLQGKKPHVVTPPHKVEPVVVPVSHPVGGTKYSLLIGINYYCDPVNQLSGCINDIKNFKDLLVNKFDYKPENITMLSDDQDAAHMPTKKNILDNINRIVAQLVTGDTFFIEYSGHGGNVKSNDEDENDNPDTP